METLMSVLEAAPSVDAIELSWLHELSNVGEARQTIEGLLDAYNAQSGTSREILQNQCVMHTLATLLELVQQRHQALPEGSAATGLSSFGIYCRRDGPHHPSHAVNPAWALTPDDYLLLSMFLNETATTTNPVVFASWSRATRIVFPAATTMAYPPTSTFEKNEEVETTRASLESELHSLREIVAKRLTSSVENLHRVTYYEHARRSLQSSSWALLGALAGCHCSSAGERIATELEAVVEGMLQPLNVALQEQLKGPYGRAGEASRNGGVGGERSTKKTSPVLVTALLQDVEDVVWALPHIVASATVKQEANSEWKEAVCTRAANFVVEMLLKFAQQYIALRQQRQLESTEDDTTSALADGWGARRTLRGAKKDIFRVYHVQRSVQRVLSAGLHLRRTPAAMAATLGITTDLSLVSDVAYNGLQAAVSAFGGAIILSDPFSPTSLLGGEEGEVTDTPASSPGIKQSSEAAEWSIQSGYGGRLRDCRRVLMPSHHLTTSGGAADAGGDFDIFQDEEGALLGHREAYLKTSLGPVTASALVDMVMLTVSRMDFMSEDTIQELHRRGLEQMQLIAAYQAQREEVEKQRQMERQGVEAIAPGKLVEHVKDSAALHMRGAQILRKVSARARLERAAFSSILNSYQHVRGEAEARIRLTQALIARCLVQLPASLADSAMDELLWPLRKELMKAQTQRDAAASASPGGNVANTNAAMAPLFFTSSYYQLALQVLFMYHASQAPVHQRSNLWNSSLIIGGGGANAAAAGVLDEEGTALDDGLGTGGETMHSETSFAIDVDSPIAFLYDEDVHRASYDIGAKRPREEMDGAGGEVDTAFIARGPTGGGANAEGEEDFSFLNDTVTAPSTYSHALCRILDLIRTARLNPILLDILLQAPALTRHVWHHLYKDFCLSADKASCVIGMWLLRNLAVRRPVYRTCAVNILLQLCLSTHDYARRFAIKEVDQLLSAVSASGTPLLDKTSEEHLLRYAKKQLFAIPVYQRPSSGSKLKRGHDGGDAANNDEDAATMDKVEATAKERGRMSTVLNRRLGLFLMLCARQPRALFPALLEVFQQCVDRGNTLMMQLLPENADVRRMTQHLLKTDASHFVSDVMPLLRKRCREARPLVQSMLWSIREQLGVMAQEASTALNTIASSSNGVDAASQAASNAKLETLRNISHAVVGHAKAMYELSGIPLGDAQHAASLPDIRYLAPFLSFLSATELRQTYLNTFLLFVQVQLQFQRRYHDAFHRLSAKERTYVLEGTELRVFQTQVLREVFVKCPIPFQDGVSRGLTRVDFFVYLHRAPQESQARLASTMLGGTFHSDGMGSGSAGAVGGVLDSLDEGGQAAAVGNRAHDGKEPKAELPPISVGTTKEVVSLCFELTRTFDSTTVEKLYGPAEVQKALQQLMHPPPVPSQLMATVLQAATLFVRSRYMDFIQFVVFTVLNPLERASVWETDPQLWKGVILFTERYYRECSNFLVNLPDQVLTQALREYPQLCEYFKEEHGNNASFMHILGNL